jgi:hypothetical protein
MMVEVISHNVLVGRCTSDLRAVILGSLHSVYIEQCRHTNTTLYFAIRRPLRQSASVVNNAAQNYPCVSVKLCIAVTFILITIIYLPSHITEFR